MTDAGITPEVTDHAGDAARLLERDGACVLRWPRLAKREVGVAGRAVLGRRVRVAWDARTIRPNPKPGYPKRIVRDKRLILESTVIEDGVLAGKAQPVHTEGWGLGAARPDVVVFQCAEDPEVGGGSYLLDGPRLVEGLGAGSNGARELVRFLCDPDGFGRDEPAVSGAALVGQTRHGRLAVSFELPPPWGCDEGELARRDALIERWHRHVREAAARTPRIVLDPGDVLIMDNYRALLGRDPYRGARTYYRSWFWTDAVFSWPLVTEVPSHRNG